MSSPAGLGSIAMFSVGWTSTIVASPFVAIGFQNDHLGFPFRNSVRRQLEKQHKIMVELSGTQLCRRCLEHWKARGRLEPNEIATAALD
jgi:hypothetical protein